MSNQKITLRASYDPEVDSAYIYLTDIGNDDITETLSLDDFSTSLKGDINFDLDKTGRLRGIEIIGASKVLPALLLKDLK